MAQTPIQTGKRLIKEAEVPTGGTLFLIIAPIFLIGGGVGLGWLAYQIPLTSYASYLPQAVGIFAVLLGLIVWLIIVAIVPPYIHFAKKSAEAILSVGKGQAHYVRALIGAGYSFWEYDIAKKEVYFSAQMLNMLGYGDREDRKPISFWIDSVHPDDREGVERSMKFHIEKRTPDYSIEYRIKKANGEFLWVADRGSATVDHDGRAMLLSGITQDISNVRRVQEVLESRTNELEDAKNKIEEEVQNVRKFQKAVDSSTEAVSIATPNGSIVYVNRAWTILNGYTDAEALGRNTRILKSTETSPEIFTAMWEKISAGLPYHTDDIINRRKDGTTYQAELSIFPIREGDQTLFYVSLCQDVTLRKDIDRAKTEFVSLASHQLRTPLSAIRWYSEMLLSKYVGELNAKQRQYVKEIYEGNLRMVDLVNALLNVSRIDLGTFAIEPEPVSLVEICESVLSELTPQITQRKQEVERLFANAPAQYNADPKLIRIVFQNFLSNSVKYTQPGGRIVAEISTRENNVYIRVTDNGYGIPKAQQGKIFEKLFRADNVRQKDTEGTGLGMYIVKAIVENSGGRIWFESEENKGTTFNVLMPLSGMPKKTGAKGLT